MLSYAHLLALGTDNEWKLFLSWLTSLYHSLDADNFARFSSLFQIKDFWHLRFFFERKIVHKQMWKQNNKSLFFFLQKSNCSSRQFGIEKVNIVVKRTVSTQKFFPEPLNCKCIASILLSTFTWWVLVTLG